DEGRVAEDADGEPVDDAVAVGWVVSVGSRVVVMVLSFGGEPRTTSGRGPDRPGHDDVPAAARSSGRGQDRSRLRGQPPPALRDHAPTLRPASRGRAPRREWSDA